MFEELLKFAEKSDEGRSKIVFNIFKLILQLIIASLIYKWLFPPYNVLDITLKNVLEFFTKKEFAYSVISLFLSSAIYLIMNTAIYFLVEIRASKRRNELLTKFTIPKGLTTYKVLRTVYKKVFPDPEVERILKRLYLVTEHKGIFSEGVLYSFFEEFVILEEEKRKNVLKVFYNMITIFIYLGVFFIGYLNSLPSVFLALGLFLCSLFLVYFTAIFMAINHFLEEFELILNMLDSYILWKNK